MKSECNKIRKGVKCKIYFDYEENSNVIYFDDIKQLCTTNKMIKPCTPYFYYNNSIYFQNNIIIYSK